MDAFVEPDPVTAQTRTPPEQDAYRVRERPVPFDVEAWRDRVQAAAARIGPLPGPSSTEILRAMRYDDEEA